MEPHLDRDLGVDVLVIGAGIQGLYIARELSPTYSVCVVSDPAVASSTFESDGYFSAGYDGNDVNRMQPARRAAAWWRLWAESNQVPFEPEPAWYVVPPDDLGTRTRLWGDATLGATQADELPPAVGGGSLEGHTPFRVDSDVVMDPATVSTQLRRGIEGRCIEGEVVRFGLVSDDAIDYVQVQVDELSVPIVPRFVVLAAGAGNADLLTKLSSRFGDQAKRKTSKELVDSCQAVRNQYRLCIRGRDLPELSGRFGEVTIASHTLSDSGDRVWVVTPPIDDARTTLGPVNLRFEPGLEHAAVAKTVERLFAVSPMVERQARSLEWSIYVSRRAQHPMLAAKDVSAIARPVPAKLEKFGLESFLTVWPSHLAYAQFVGDAVAERITEALGKPGDFSDGPQPSDLAQTVPQLRARWDRTDFDWHEWAVFARTYLLEAG